MLPREAGEVSGTLVLEVLMAQTIFFDKRELFWVREALEVAETLAENYFSLDLEDFERYPYDLRTLANLKGQEVTNRALAQVCKYEYRKNDSSRRVGGREFYRICLQDHKILKVVRAEPPSLLRSLILYVVTHELIHVIRFSTAPHRFHLHPQEREIEERDVHRTTYELLKTLEDPQVWLLLERYRPWWGKSMAA